MIEVSLTRTHIEHFSLKPDEAKEVVINYIKSIIGSNCQVLDNGHLRQIIENYHGSDSWKANEFLQELYKE